MAPYALLSRRLFPYVLIAPAVLLCALVLLYPLAQAVRISLYRKVLGFPERFIGLANFGDLFGDAQFLNSLGITFWWTVGSVLGQVLLGFGLAILLNRSFRGRALYRTLFLLPWVLPNFIAALTWVWMFNDRFGIIPSLLVGLGLVNERTLFLADPGLALPAVIAVNVWKNYAFVMIVMLAALQAIPHDLYEAARVDGASFLQEFRSITLPLVKPMLFIVILLRVIWTFNTFELVFIMTEGGPGRSTEILTITAFLQAFRGGVMGYGSAIGVILLILTLAFALFYVRLQGRTLRGEV
jgi:multiple sugar transport system permease protein